MIVTAELLERRGACEPVVDRFRELFPTGTRVTIKLCVEHALQFDFEWAARNLLPWGTFHDFRDDVARARRRYWRAMYSKRGHSHDDVMTCAQCVAVNRAVHRLRRVQAEAFARAARVADAEARETS